MKTLYIDTHKEIHIALLDDARVINEIIIKDKNENSKYLMNAVIDVVDNQTYDQILVINGPGSFTGVRLGVTIAKTLAYTENIPLKAMTYLELISICSKNNLSKVGFSEKNGYFIGEIDKKTKKISSSYYLNNKEFEKIKTDVTIDFELCFISIIEYAKYIETINPHLLKPVYIKKIEVEK